MEALKDFAPGGWWAPNPRALRKVRCGSCSFCPKYLSPRTKGHVRHLYPLPPSLTGSQPETLCPVHVPKAGRRELKRPRGPAPQLFAVLGALRPSTSPPHSCFQLGPITPTPLLGCFLPVTCPSLSSSQVTPPFQEALHAITQAPLPHFLQQTAWDALSSSDTGHPASQVFLPQISSLLSHLRASESPVSPGSPTSKILQGRSISLRFSMSLSQMGDQ